VDEVTESATNATLAAVETTTGFAEVGDGTQLAVDGPRGIPAAVEVVASLLRTVLVLEARVHITDQVVIIVVAHD